MSLAEKYRPRKYKELVGNRKSITLLKKSLPDRHVLIHGPPGIGKTSFALLWGKDNMYDIMHLNASDSRNKDTWDDIYRRSRVIGNILFIIDEADGIEWWRHYIRIFDTIHKSKHPFIFIANQDWKIKSFEKRWIREKNKRRKLNKVKEAFMKVKFYPPSLNEVIARLKYIEKSVGIKFDYRYVTRDLRASLIAVISHSNKVVTSDQNIYEILTDLFEKQIVDKIKFPDDLIWIYDNIPKVYSSYDMVLAFEILILAVKSNRRDILKLLPTGKVDHRFSQPMYSKRLRLYRQKNKVKEDE